VITQEQMMRLVRARLSRVLLFAEAALPEKQFKPFRKLVLDEFGNSGLGKELERLFGNRPRQDR
jgi:hypothetical protein